MPKNPLDEAEALWKRRDWKGLISLLEPLSGVYRDNARFSALLGAAYLQRDDVGGAFSCFRRAQSLDFRDVLSARGLAAVYILRGETDKAVQLYVDILERHPSERTAARGLAYLRRYGAEGEGLPPARLRRLYPAPGRGRGLLVALALAALAALVVLIAYPTVERRLASRPGRDGVSDVRLSPDELASPVGSVGGFELVLTEKEAVDTFEKAKRLFSDYRDEAALVELNRLRLSNATRQVKAKADALALYVREPSFGSMPDRFSYAEVSAYPRLYEGVGVIWKGLPANVEGGPDGPSSFDLLVGYHDKRRLEGIVRVKAAFGLRLQPDRPVEALARVRLGEGGFYLECLALHEQ